MRSHALAVYLILAWLLSPYVTAADAPDMGQASAELQRQPTPLAQWVYLHGLGVNDPDMTSWLGQMKATASSVVGNYGEALREFPMGTLGASTYPTTSKYRAEDAADVIARLAARRHIVMVNEAHHDASTRVLTLALLPKLRAEGYTYFAAEALPEGTQAFSRGYVHQQKGMSYLNEPLYAEMIRQAIRLGFTIVPYDIASMGNMREHDQAKALYSAVFAHDPHARLFVHAGWEHINKGDSTKMVVQLAKLTGKDPLSVDQTLLRYAPSRPEPFYDRLVGDYPGTLPAILVDKSTGHAYSAKPGNYDVTVLAPRVLTGDGRGDWLGLGGQRHAVRVDGTACRSRYPCMVQARYASDAIDAVPADQAVLAADGEPRQIYLRPGAYRLSGTAADGTVLSTSVLQVAP
jgi:hypothetical protein